METLFYPERQDVEQYRRWRASLMELNNKMIRTVPREAYQDVGDALGIRHNGVLVFDSEDMSSVLMDCCIYDWFQNGKNVVQRYSETHATTTGTDESHVLNACLQAKYAVLVAQSPVPGAGLYCQDILNGGELFLMDVALSQSLNQAGAALATRIIPLAQHWITSGAGLPISSTGADLDRIDSKTKKVAGIPWASGAMARAFLSRGRRRRACPLRNSNLRTSEAKKPSPPASILKGCYQ
jgi:hypothetical protein